MDHTGAGPPLPPKRRPGRPPVYVFTKPDAELSENERRLKGAVLKRRQRQNRSYHRKKRMRQLQANDEASAAAAVNASTFRTPLPVLASSSQRLNQIPIVNSQNTHQTGAVSPQPPQTSMHFSMPPLSLPALAPPNHSQLLRPPPNYNVTQQQTRPALSSFSLSPSVPRCGDVVGAGNSNPLPASTNVIVPQHTLNAHAQGRVLDPLSPTSFVSPEPSSSTPRNNIVTGENHAFQQLLDLSSNAGAQRHPAPQQGGSSQPLDSTPTLQNESRLHGSENRDIASQISSLPPNVVDVVPYLITFPSSFSVEAAFSVCAPSDIDMATFMNAFVQQLLNLGLMRREVSSERFVMDESVRKFFAAPSRCWKVGDPRMRFVEYFSEKLRNCNGHIYNSTFTERSQATRDFALEETNIREAISFARQESAIRYIRILSIGAPTLRVCLSARERIELFSTALEDIEKDHRGLVSNNHAQCGILDNNLGRRDEHGDLVENVGNNNQNEDTEAEARVRLSLAEAFLDALSSQNGRFHLSSAISAMTREESNLVPSDMDRGVSSIIARILLAELRTFDGVLDRAFDLLREALQKLRELGLHKSTYTISCFLGLASVHMARIQQKHVQVTEHPEEACDENDDEKSQALNTVQRAMDMVKELGLERTPFYADVLRTLANVQLRLGNVKEAQLTLSSALRTVENWHSGNTEWTSPVTNDGSLGLHALVMEDIGQTYTLQNRHDEASKYLHRASQFRRENGLHLRNESETEVPNVQNPLMSSGIEIMTRHLY